MNESTKQTIIDIYNDDIKKYQKQIKKFTKNNDSFQLKIAIGCINYTRRELNKIQNNS